MQEYTVRLKTSTLLLLNSLVGALPWLGVVMNLHRIAQGAEEVALGTIENSEKISVNFSQENCVLSLASYSHATQFVLLCEMIEKFRPSLDLEKDEIKKMFLFFNQMITEALNRWIRNDQCYYAAILSMLSEFSSSIDLSSSSNQQEIHAKVACLQALSSSFQKNSSSLIILTEALNLFLKRVKKLRYFSLYQSFRGPIISLTLRKRLLAVGRSLIAMDGLSATFHQWAKISGTFSYKTILS